MMSMCGKLSTEAGLERKFATRRTFLFKEHFGFAARERNDFLTHV